MICWRPWQQANINCNDTCDAMHFCNRNGWEKGCKHQTEVTIAKQLANFTSTQKMQPTCAPKGCEQTKVCATLTWVSWKLSVCWWLRRIAGSQVFQHWQGQQRFGMKISFHWIWRLSDSKEMVPFGEDRTSMNGVDAPHVINLVTETHLCTPE